MPPERHSPPPPRPPRDRYPGGGFSGPRRPFGGPPREGREGGSRPPFTPRPPFQPAEPQQSVRLRDGEREVEVHGGAAFVRQVLDDLPALLARLRGEQAPLSRPASISMPAPPRGATAAAPAHRSEPEPADELLDEEDEDEFEEEPEQPPAPRHRRERHQPSAGNGKPRANGRLSLEDKVFRALEHADHPLSVAAIRKQVGGDTTGQQIRRILERASDRVIATSERPAAYALR